MKPPGCGWQRTLSSRRVAGLPDSSLDGGVAVVDEQGRADLEHVGGGLARMITDFTKP
jgi:hypothetical protein